MAIRQKVAIMGCGPGGSYLYSLLRRKNPSLDITIYDVIQRTSCGIKGCAWGVSWLQFTQLCQEVDMIPERYLLGAYSQVQINNIKIKANVAMINKPLLIKDLLDGQLPLEPSAADLNTFDRIIDATGAYRAYLSPHPDSHIAYTVQVRAAIQPIRYPIIFVNRNSGYGWFMPLSAAEAHIGALSHLGPVVASQDMENIRRSFNTDDVRCSCTGQIKFHGPVLPFVEGRVWGLGEAIGLVDPVFKAGIVTAMMSAKLMAENWDSAQLYTKRVWRRYSYMLKEARVLAKFMAGGNPGYKDMILPRRAFETIGIKPKLRQIINSTRAISRC